VAEIAAKLHMAAMQDIRRLEAEVMIRDGRLNWARGEKEKAHAAIQRALNWCPNHAGARRTQAEYYLQDGKLDDAREAVNLAIENAPNMFEYWHFKGIVCARLDDTAAAHEAQKRALELNPTHEASRREFTRLSNLLCPETVTIEA
jgi:tetratricopeptide (TPR) repeat protein